MKLPLRSTLFTAVCLLAASQPLLAATTKADVRNAELVVALQAVSPDPLSGRLGLAAATAQAAALPAAKTTDVAMQDRNGKSDQLAYAQWKGARKS